MGNNGVVVAVSPRRLSSTSQHRVPGCAAYCAENQLLEPRPARAAKATEDSVESGKLTAKQQLRAYVSARSTKLFIHDDEGVEIAMELHNSGQTPAYALE